MATAQVQTETVASRTAGKILLKGATPSFGDWRDDLHRNGVAVVKGAVPKERAAEYASQMHQWLEDFNLGYKRDDPSTVHESKLPCITEKGMVFGYGISHERFAWDVRQEPGVVGAFESVYETEDVIVSFDSVNYTFPNRKDLKPNNPWPHQDQDPEKPGFRCLQGLVNLLPNGPNDGGLIVCKGAHLLSEEFHDEFKGDPEKIWAWTKEWYGYTESGMKWLKDRGFTWEKICMEPGDLVVWDSRTPHYNLSPSPESTQPRFAVYTCYMPVADASQEDLLRKKAAFENMQSTTHWPNAMHVGGLKPMRDGEECPHNFATPRSGRPQLTERGYKLTGIPYIKE